MSNGDRFPLKPTGQIKHILMQMEETGGVFFKWLGQNRFGIPTYFSGDGDVHWGYGILTRGQTSRNQN